MESAYVKIFARKENSFWYQDIENNIISISEELFDKLYSLYQGNAKGQTTEDGYDIYIFIKPVKI